MRSAYGFLIVHAVVVIASAHDVGNCKYVTIPVCGDEGETTTVTGHVDVRGPIGAPGKMGPVGQIGAKGKKGDMGKPGLDGRNARPEEIEELVNREVKKREIQTLQISGVDRCINASAGIYMVHGDLFSCDGNGWTIFQHRQDGSVNFERSWIDYRLGFGSLGGEFWIGLETLQKLQYGRSCKLRVELGSFNDETAFAEYSSFTIGDEGKNYQISVSGYRGTAGDSMAYGNEMMFTTKDKDNDEHASNCASGYGGWWFKSCFHASLNAPWGRSTGRWKNIVWKGWKGFDEALQTSTMKIQCS